MYIKVTQVDLKMWPLWIVALYMQVKIICTIHLYVVDHLHFWTFLNRSQIGRYMYVDSAQSLSLYNAPLYFSVNSAYYIHIKYNKCIIRTSYCGQIASHNLSSLKKELFIHHIFQNIITYSTRSHFTSVWLFIIYLLFI
jgi:hypothetical protein